MSALEHDAPTPHEGSDGKLDGVKRLLGKKVMGIPVIFFVLAAAAAGLYLMHRNSSSGDADTTGDASTGQYTDGSGVTDPGGVSGLGDAASGYGGSGGANGLTSSDAADLSGAIASLGDAVAAIEFPSGNPAAGGQTASEALSGVDPTVVAAAAAKKAPKAPVKTKPRGGHAIAVKPKVHPVVAARPKPKPAAAPKRAAPKPAAGKAKVKPKPPVHVAPKPAPKKAAPPPKKKAPPPPPRVRR